MDEQESAPLLSEKDREGVNDEKRAEEIGRDVDAEFVIFGSVTNLGGWYNLDLAIVDLTKDEPKTTRAPQSVAENNVIPALRDVAHQFRSIIDGVDYNQQKLSSNNQQELPVTISRNFPVTINRNFPVTTSRNFPAKAIYRKNRRPWGCFSRQRMKAMKPHPWVKPLFA